MNRVSLVVLGTFVLILIVTGVLAYVFRQPGTGSNYNAGARGESGAAATGHSINW